jgi:hypothetical protein
VTRLPGINGELAAAVRRVNAVYSRIPEDDRPDVTGQAWSQLEANLDRSCAAGDYYEARGAIEAWERHAMRVLRGERA